MQPLSAAQLDAFEGQGFVCLEGGLTPKELDEAEATWDRLTSAGVVGLSNSSDTNKQAALARDPGFIKLMCHPYFESIAKQVLRSDAVRVIELGPHERKPTPEADAPDPKKMWADGAHIDFQITTADWNAAPRRDLLAMWLWVNDVPAERAAMRVVPGR